MGVGIIVVTNSSWVLAESRSPAQLGVASFLVQAGSPSGSDTYFFVRDPSARPGFPIRVGGPYISDGDVKMNKAVWSKDGTVIGVRVNVGEPSGKGFGRFDGTFWLDAYDFRKHRAVTVGKTIRERSRAIEWLFAERGGIGPQSLSAPPVVGRGIGWMESLQYDTSNAHGERFRYANQDRVTPEN